jgi:hypothetical protein
LQKLEMVSPGGRCQLPRRPDGAMLVDGFAGRASAAALASGVIDATASLSIDAASGAHAGSADLAPMSSRPCIVVIRRLPEVVTLTRQLALVKNLLTIGSVDSGPSTL